VLALALTRRRLLIGLGAATAALYVALAVIDFQLKDTGGPGILEFEFVGSAGNAAETLAEWGDHGRDLATLSLWLDFAFMAAYGSFFALAALATRDFARDRGLRSLAAAGAFAPYCAIFAALYDAAENTALLLVVGGHGGGAAPVIAAVCASIKFLLIGLAIGYVLWGLAARLALRHHSPERTTGP
jgi:hypothetical protein